jgi:probable F420-dependent oxidoreductase
MMHDRTFRFGVGCNKARSRKEFTELARKIEALGYSTMFVPDHFVDHDLAPTVALTHSAAVTDQLRVGTFVLGNDYKHPVVCAREMASLDLLSDGRLELGIGAGWMTADYERAGIPLDPPGARIDRLAESIAVLKGLWAEGPFTFEGRHYRIDGLDGEPKPVQRPHPPLIVGGGGRRVLSLAAREADIVGINANLRSGKADDPTTAPSMNLDATDQKLAWVRDAAGARFDDLEIQVLAGFVHFTDDSRSIAEAMAPFFESTPEQVLESPVALVGTADEMVETLQRRRERWQMSYFVVPAESIDETAPIVAKLAGT